MNSFFPISRRDFSRRFFRLTTAKSACKFLPNWFTLEELVANGTVSHAFRDQLIKAVARRENILISGPTGCGKTTLVKALLDLIPKQERVLLIEDTAELPLDRPNRVRFTAREGVSIRDLLKASLRHRPDRIVVGGGARRRGLRSAASPQHGARRLDLHPPCQFRRPRAESPGAARAPS